MHPSVCLITWNVVICGRILRLIKDSETDRSEFNVFKAFNNFTIFTFEFEKC